MKDGERDTQFDAVGLNYRIVSMDFGLIFKVHDVRHARTATLPDSNSQAQGIILCLELPQMRRRFV